MNIAIQGQKDSFHEIAARKIWPTENLNFTYCDSFSELYEKVAINDNLTGLSAIENSLYGSIHEVYDLLLRNKFWISAETTLRIHQQLITLSELELAEIKEVHSHPVAIEQCRHWLSTNLPNAELIEAEDTAGAARFIKDNDLTYTAAIASEQAATSLQMSIVARNIEDEKSNYTRFIVIQKQKTTNKDADKASIRLTAHHKPGALYGALGILSNLGINLTKIESRPIRNRKFLYQFIIDLETDSDHLKQAVHNLRAYGCDVTVLGHYISVE